MGVDQSAEELLEQCCTDMGNELGSVYDALRNEVTWLHAKWSQYRQLYGRSPTRVDLLNEAAGFFFGVIQTCLLEDVLLHLARLTDPSKSVGKANLTLQRLPPLLSDARLRSEVSELISTALNECGTARAWRNRHLAHRDLALTQASPTDPLPEVCRAKIDEALASVRAVLNRLEEYYWCSETAYQHGIMSSRDADSLVSCLRLGLRAKEQRLERLERGEWLPEDTQHEDEV